MVPYWRLSSLYGFYFASLGGLVPFWSLYLKARGFNATEIGELNALLVGTKVIAPYIGGWLADRYGKSLRIIRSTLFISALLFLGLLQAKSYQAFVVVVISFSFFWNAALPQFEAATLFHLHTEVLHYARIRLWGSIGFIIAVLGMGWLFDQYPIILLPWLISGLLLFAWMAALTIPETQLVSKAHTQPGINAVMMQGKVVAFLLTYLLLQIGHSPYYVFFSLYLQNYHYSKTIIGSLWALGVVAEIILFITARPVLQRFSLRSVLLFSIGFSIVRWVLIASYAHYLPFIISAQALHALSFASLHVVAMQLIQHYFGKSHQGKGQAFYTSVSFGIGGVTGGYYSGYYWTYLGQERLFLLAAGCCLLAGLLAALWVKK